MAIYPELPREIDYIAYLIDECTLSEWESGFCKSCLSWLRGRGDRLSAKQAVCLTKMVVKFRLETEHKEFCVRGYADRSNEQVMNNIGPGSVVQSTKMAQANDDYEDDIPF